MRSRCPAAIVLAVNVLALYMIYIWAPPERLLGDSYRVFFIHTPSAWVCYLAFAITFISSVLYLRTGNLKWDLYAASSSVLGILFSTITLITGSIWARLAWGLYWNWDPRETATLILLLAYLGYVSFRMSISIRERRARVSAVLGVLLFISVPLSYFSAVLWATLHPMPLLPSLGLRLGVEPPILLTLVVSMLGITLLFVWMFYLTLRTYGLVNGFEGYVERR
ncbi:MAG: cytochrome c biogenesis protein CcsA [Candidatus Bathyarchaeia archaeon]